jgi:hypothetical protein
VDPRTQQALQVEIKTASSRGGFERQLGQALERDGKQPGLTAIQVPAGTTPAMAQLWLDQFWNSSPARNAVPQGSILVVDPSGRVLIPVRPVPPKPVTALKSGK